MGNGITLTNSVLARRFRPIISAIVSVNIYINSSPAASDFFHVSV
jgi:hypothetical protein